jgi:hypothetical protein
MKVMRDPYRRFLADFPGADLTDFAGFAAARAGAGLRGFATMTGFGVFAAFAGLLLALAVLAGATFAATGFAGMAFAATGFAAAAFTAAGFAATGLTSFTDAPGSSSPPARATATGAGFGLCSLMVPLGASGERCTIVNRNWSSAV